MRYSRGFSLVELLVVMGIVVLLASILIVNFREPSVSSIGRHQVSSMVISDLRRVQSLSLAGTAYSGSTSPTCGYGIHYVNESSYVVFARILDGASSCSSIAALLYDVTYDRNIESKVISNPKIKFVAPFDDIYYAIPYASVFVRGVPLTPTSTISTNITIYAPSRPTSITTIEVTNSGGIDLLN